MTTLQLAKDNIPKHIAVIMDGNGRWATQQGLKRIMGHQHALEAVRQTVEGCAELGVQYLTLFAFSTENWSRPLAEVNALMKLLVDSIEKETPTLLKNNIKLQSIGNTADLPKNTLKTLELCKNKTQHATGMVLNLALSYSSKWEIINAMQKIAQKVASKEILPEAIDETLINQHLATYPMPDPELMIRTSGEQRISNFMLWQLSYSELYFSPVLWPDFRKIHLHQAIASYQTRERRFGKTSKQIKA